MIDATGLLRRWCDGSALAIFVVTWSVAGVASATFEETFESYADTAALEAVWVPTGDAGNLDTALGNPGQSAFHPASGVNVRAIDPLLPLEDRPIVVSVDIYDDGTSSNERVTLGLRNGPANILELGHFNGILDGFHAFRVINFGGDNPNWDRFDLPTDENAPTSDGAWNRYRAEISLNSITLTLDLGADGSIDAINTVAAEISPGGFSEVRFGGPSGVSSAGGGANFDNISAFLAAPPVDGDVNGDEVVNMMDYEILRDNLFTGSLRAQGDLDGDFDVDFDDFRILKTSFSAGAASVPEPSGWLLFSMGSAWLLGSISARMRRCDN